MIELDYKNALERLISYSIFSKKNNTNTISEISDTFSIPSDIIRNDFVMLFEQGVLKWVIDYDVLNTEEISNLRSLYENYYGKKFKPSDMEEISCKLMKDLNNTPSSNIKTHKLITSGRLDHIPFSIYDSYFDNNDDECFDYSDEECVNVPVNIEEYLAYFNLFESKSYPKYESDEKTIITSTIRNKKYLCDFKPFVLENLYSIKTQIEIGGSLKFDYTPYGSSKIKDNMVKPLKIGFDATENRYVMISAFDNKIYTHDVECMSKINVAKEAPSDPSLIDKIPHEKVWGFEYDKCLDDSGKTTNPLRVKVMFYCNEANVINKAKRDLAYRNPVNLYHDEDGNLIYEDDIYGKDSFIRWILSYGSSVRILEPQSLIDEFIEILSKFILGDYI